MKNIYACLLALVWLSAGSIQAKAGIDNTETHSDGLAVAPTFTYTKTDVTQCNGQLTGSITVTASGGTGPYQYSRDNGATYQADNQFANLAGGTYQVMVKDGSNTPSIAQAVTINQPTAIVAGVTSMTQTCPGLSVGAYSLTASGGTGPYQYSLDDGKTYQTSSLFTGLGVGSYSLAVKDANGCVVKPASYQMTSSVAPTLTPQVTNVSCHGGQNGSIQVNLTGGANLGQVYASINNGTSFTTNLIFNALSANSYQVVVKYGNSCLTLVQSVSLTQPAALTFSTQITGTIDCFGNSTGGIQVTADGGTAPYQFSKNNGASYQEGSQFGELVAGSYPIIVKDANGCTAPAQTVVLSQPTAVTYTITQTNVSCFDGTDGRISIEASGGTGPYEYSFSGRGPASISNPLIPRTTSRLTAGRGARDAAGATYDNLAAQTYYLSIYDANGCYASASVTINQPSAVVVEASVNSARCNGSSTGSITVIPSGGTPPYKYSRDNGTTFQDSDQFTGLPAGTYPVVVRDANNCLSSARSVEVTEPSVVTFTTTQTDAACFGSSTGSIEVSASGGIDSYQYSRDNGATYQSNNAFTDLAAGTYQVVVKDANGCVASGQSLTIGQPTLLVFSVAKTDVTDCYGSSSGSLSVSASGGTAYYLYSIDNGSRYTDDRQFANLEAGTYSVVVKDAKGCIAPPQSVTISQPTALTYTLTEVDVSCFGGKNGRISIVAQGGTSPYQYVFSRSGPASITNPGSRGPQVAAGEQYDNLTAQTYYLTVNDANGCSVNLTSTINQPSAIAVEVSASSVRCNGGSSGRITVTASGGTGGYQYSKDNGASYQPANQFDNLSAGTYAVVVKDANDCVTAAQSVTVTQPAVLTASIGKTDVTTCFGGTNGSITVTASGGTGPYQYSKDNGATYQSGNAFSNLSAGTYAIMVKDANDCTTTAQSITITQPAVVTLSLSKTNVTACFGSSTGSISVTASGGTGTYQYSIDNGASFQPGNQFSGLPAGTYPVVVKDANGCVSTTQSTTISQPAALSATTTATRVSCFSGTNGSIAVQVTGGTAPYRYSITDGSTFQTSNQFNGLSAGTYHIVVRDANGCSVDAPVTEVTQPPAVTFSTSQTDVVCFGGNSGSITVSASGGTGAYQYSKDNGVNFQSGNQFLNLVAGTYPILVRDANNCLSGVQSLTISQPGSISLTVTKTDVTSCFGGTNGTLTLTASGGNREFQYSIDNGQTYHGPVFEGLAAGTYTVLARDGYACTTTSQTVVISQPTAVSFTTAKTDVTTCFSASTGSIAVTASGGTGGYQYSKDNGVSFQTANSFAGLAAGTYSIVVKDANGCTTSAQSVVISQPTAIVAGVTSMTQTCPGLSVGAYSLTASGGTGPYQYSLDDGKTYQTSSLFTGLGVGAYSLAVKDANGCVVKPASYQMTSSVAPTLTPQVTNVSCHGGQNGSIQVNLTGGADLGQVYASINNGASFTTNLIFNALSANSYQVVVKYGNSCLTPVQSVSLTQPAALTFSTSKADVTSCFGNTTGSISVTATGGTAPYQYSRDNGATFQKENLFANLGAGTYAVIVNDANGCQTSAQSVVLTQPPAISYTVAQTNVSCNSSATGSFTVTASGGTPPYRLSLNGGEFNAMRSPSGLTAGAYTIVVGDANGCTTGQSTVTITQPDQLTFTSKKTDVSCAGGNTGQITLTASGGTAPYQYSKDNGASYQTGNQFTSLGAGTYPIIVKDANNCVTPAQSVTIAQPAVLSSVIAKTDVTPCFGSTNGSISVTATGGNGSYQYSHNNGTTYQPSSTFTNLNAGTYLVVVKDGNNCTTTAQSITITQPAVVTLSLSKTNVTTCFGAGTGSISLTASGGTGAYQYSIDNEASFQPGNQFSGLPAGTYPVVVKDANGCVSTTQSTTITQPAALSANTTATSVSCFSGANGSIAVQVTGGTAPYRYSITDGSTFQTSNQFNGLSAGTYHIVVRDTNGCSVDAPVTEVTQPPAVTFSTGQTDVACFGGNSGSITVSAMGGTGAYQYSKNNGATFQSGNQFSNLAAGTYSVVVKDANGCLSSVRSVSLSQPPALVVRASKVDVVDCASANSGSISLSATGGSGAYQYSINNGGSYQSSPQFTGLQAGAYAVIVKDANGCQTPASVTLTPACCLTTVASPSSITNGQSATLTASGCSGTVSWAGGPSHSVYVVNPTQTTSYTAICSISGGGTCRSEVTVTVNQPSCGMEVAASPATITSGQSSTLTATGCGNGTISWKGGPTNSSIYVVSPTQTTSYTATCTIATSGSSVICSYITTVTVIPVCAISVAANPATITNGQSSTLTASGCSGTVSWVGGPTNSVYVVNPTQTTSYTAICSIATSGTPVTCTSVVTVTVNQPPCNLVTSASPLTITNGQSSTLTASGCSGAITWTNTEQMGSSIVVNPSRTTTYVATCSIATSGSPVSCTSAITVTVNQPICSIITSASPATITSGQSSTLTASGCNGAVYWGGGGVERGGNSIVVNPTQTTTYTASCVITTSGNPVICTSEVTVTIGQPVCNITTSASPTTITNGQSATLTASGCNGTVIWAGGPTNSVYVVNPTQTTTYMAICTLSASNTCSSQVTVTVNQPVCTLTTSASPTTITNGQSATLTASGCSGTVSWAGGPANSVYVVNPTQTTSYTATCSIATSGTPVTCSSIVTVTVNQPVCNLSTSASPTTITVGQSATLTASGCSGAITWTNTEQTGSSIVVNPSVTTTYVATCSIATSGSPVSCTSAVTVTVKPIPCNLTTSASPLTITNGQSSTLTASGCTGAISWVGTAQEGPIYVVNPTQTTTYTAICTLTASNTCSSQVTVTVNQPVCTLTTSASPTTITNGQSSTLTASGCSGTVSWVGGPTALVYVVNPTQTTSYTAICSIATSGAPITCTSVVTVTVNQPVCALTTSASPMTIINGQSSTLTASGCSGTIIWTNTEQTGSSIIVSPSATTTYIATCTIPTSDNPVSCTSAVTVTVKPIPCTLTTSASPLTITNGQSATLTASGCNGTVSWAGGPTNSVYVVNPTQTTTYMAICTLAGSNTCSSQVTVTVNQPVCTLTSSASPLTITNGQSSTLTATGCSGTVSWNGGPTNSIYVVNPTQTTSYTATCSIPTSGAPVTCTSVVTVTVNQPVCTLTATANPTTIFNGQSTTLTATGCANGTITWSNAQQTGSTLVVSPSVTTVYTASCTIPTSGNAVVCTAPVTVTVIARPACNLQVQTTTPTIFTGGTASLTATGCGGSVSWNNGQSGAGITVSPAATTSYTAICTISTAAGSVTCLASATVTVIARPACTLSVQASPTAIFNGQSTTLTASGCADGTILWSSQQSGASIVVSPTLTTTYSATCIISTAAGSVSCAAPVSVSVTQPILQLTGSSDVLPLNAVTWIGTVTQNIETFVWQYKTATGDWVNFPSSFANSTSITVSATSFLGNAAPAYLNQAIQVRLSSPLLVSNVLTVTIRQKPPVISALTTVKAVCAGSSTGSFSLMLSRGVETGESAFQTRLFSLAGGVETLVTSYTFTGATFTSPSVLGKGSYRVRVQSIVGSQTSDEAVQDFAIDDNPPLTLSATKTDILCFGVANGTIRLVANGGVGPYQFSLNGGTFQNFQSSTQHQIDNLASGTYLIQLRDGNACQSAQPVSVTIAQPAASLTITSGVVKNPSGFQATDGTITLKVAGGTPDYSFAWSVSNPATSTQAANPGVTHTISTLGEGTYTVIVTDKAGCTTQASYTLTQPTQIQARFTIIKAVSCAKGTDGIVSVDASGGVPKSSGAPYSYSWKVKSSSVVIPQSTNRLTNVGSTAYIVTVTDGNGISRDFELFLPEPLPLVATAASLTNVSCFGLANGSASVTIQGGTAPYVTRWNTQQTGLSLANVQAGKYLAVITDANACQAQVSVQIQQPQALTMATVTANPTCFDNCDGRISVSPTGGTAPYGVTWQNLVSQSLSLTGLCSGSYTVAVTDANGCAVTQTTSLTRPTQKQIVLRANTFICKGQVVDLDGTITDGATYVWTYPDGSTKTTAIVSVTAAGKYQVVATDKNGCVATAQITLTASDTPAPTLAFAVGSKVGVNEPLIAVNLTNPRPAQSSWTAPVGAQIISSTEDQLVVTFNQVGTYPITLNGQQGQCAFKITKSVTVVAESQLATSAQTAPFIQELTILPNPNSGEFKLRITLSGIGDVKIKVKPLLSTGVDIYQQSATGQNVYELSVNIPNLQTGIYLLTLETAKAIQSTKLLIAR